MLTIIAPRHPERGTEVGGLATGTSLTAGLRSKNCPIDDQLDIYIADTLGELGLFYRLSDIAFVGGGIAPKGGSQPTRTRTAGCCDLTWSAYF